MNHRVEMIVFSFLLLICMRLTGFYFTILLKERCKAPIVQAVAWSCYFLYHIIIMIKKTEFTIPIMIWNTLLLLLICRVSYRGSLKRELLYILLLQANCTIVKNAGVFLFHCKDENSVAMVLAANIVIVFSLFILVYALQKRNILILPEPPMKEWLFWISLPLFFMFLLDMPGLKQRNGWEFPAISVYFLLINYKIYDFYDQSAKWKEARLQKDQFRQQLLLCSREAQEREAAYQESRQLRHDLKAYLLEVRELIKAAQTENAINKVDLLLGKNTIYRNGISKTGVPIIDAVINCKYAEAKALGVQIKKSITLPNILPYEGSDLCIIIGNLLDNAIEAASKLQEEERQIQFTIGVVKGALTIAVSNRYDGTLKSDLEGRLRSTKLDRKNHGIGLLSVKNVVDSYDGELLCRQEGDVFKVIVLLYLKNQ